MRFFLVVVLVFSMQTPVFGMESFEVEGVEELYQEVEGVGIDPEGSLEDGVKTLLRQGVSALDGLLRGGLSTGVLLLGVVLLCGLGEGVAGEGDRFEVVVMAGALAVTGLSVGEVGTMIYLGQETIARITAFSGGLLPVMTLLTVATGGVSAGVARQGATVLFASLLIRVIDTILIPLIYAYMATCCAEAAVGNHGLKKVADLIKSTVIGSITTLLILFVTYLTVSGTIAGSADLVAVRTTKIALTRVVPVVGGILSDAAETVLVGAGMLRGTVGVAGMLAAISICLLPFMELSIHYLTYRITAALAGTVANPRLTNLIEGLSSAFGLILGMTGACALLLLISIVSAISAVVS